MALIGEIEQIRNDLVDEGSLSFTEDKTGEHWRAREIAPSFARSSILLTPLLIRRFDGAPNERAKIGIPRIPPPNGYLGRFQLNHLINVFNLVCV